MKQFESKKVVVRVSSGSMKLKVCKEEGLMWQQRNGERGGDKIISRSLEQVKRITKRKVQNKGILEIKNHKGKYIIR